MTKSWMKLGLFITLLALFLSLESEGKKPKIKGCINEGKVYKKNQILNVDECNFKKCKKNNKRKNVFRWSKLKLNKKECCNYKKTVLSNGMEKKVDGVTVICDNGKIEIVSSENTYSWHDFNRNLDESCHESHSVARIGFPLLAQMKELQDYAEDLESEKIRILQENSTWVCGKSKLHTLIKNKRLMKTFSWLPWVQWFTNVFSRQTRSSGLPWKSVLNKYEDKFQGLDQAVNVTANQDTRIIGGNIVNPPYKYKFQAKVQALMHCGGSIITNWHILSAQHCVADNQDPDDVLVIVGLHDQRVNGNAQSIKVYSIIRLLGDLIILKLKYPVKINSRVGKIDFQQGSLDTYENKMATVTGWGCDYNAKCSVNELREVDVQVLPTTGSKCKSIPFSDAFDALCAWSHGKDSCIGDSGGPLFLPVNSIYKLIGIVSGGGKCGNGGVYVSVAKHIAFINYFVETGNCIGAIQDFYCCTSERQCDLGEGDCDSDADCKGNLVCGKNNGRKWSSDAHRYADCCKKPKSDDCFAPGSIITMEDGSFKKIEELRLGDSVLTANENFKPEFSKFLGWLHKDETKLTVYLELQTKNASIKISPKHLILKKGLHGEEIFVMAKHISLGDNVFIKFPTEDSFRWEPVENILTQNKVGVYAPLTESGTIVVDNYVASCYAEISNHNHAHSVMTPVRLMPSILEDEESQWKSGVRTYPMNLFRMAKGLGLIKNDDKTEVLNEKTAWMNTRMMNILNIELLVLLNYFVLKK